MHEYISFDRNRSNNSKKLVESLPANPPVYKTLILCTQSGERSYPIMRLVRVNSTSLRPSAQRAYELIQK